MRLTKKLITLGRGRVGGASVIAGVCEIVLKTDGKLIKKSMKENSAQLYGYVTVGYGDDLWLLPGGKLQRIGEELLYESNI